MSDDSDGDRDTGKEREGNDMTVFNLFVCCGNIGIDTMFEICENSNMDVYKGKYGEMPTEIKVRDVDWFQIYDDGKKVLLSVFGERFKNEIIDDTESAMKLLQD